MIKLLKPKVLVGALLSIAAGPQATPPSPSSVPAPAMAPAAAKPAPAAAKPTPATAAGPATAKPPGATPTAAAKPTPATPGAAAGNPQAGAAAGAAKPGEVKPLEVPLSLVQATAGIVGTGTLRAAIELERSGKAFGTLRCELFADKAPLAVANFVSLARGLRPFHDPHIDKWVKKPLFDGSQFHRVVPDFMVQAGDPWCFNDLHCGGREGAGDPGFTVPDEIRDDLRFDRPGRMAMALRGVPNSAGSQFFITERDTPWLTGTHTIFGQCEPVELIRAMTAVETGLLDMPKEALRIKRVVVTRQQPLANK